MPPLGVEDEVDAGEVPDAEGLGEGAGVAMDALGQAGAEVRGKVVAGVIAGVLGLVVVGAIGGGDPCYELDTVPACGNPWNRPLDDYHYLP